MDPLCYCVEKYTINSWEKTEVVGVRLLQISKSEMMVAKKGNISLNKLPGEVVENMHGFFTNVLKLKILEWTHLNTCI